MQQVGQRVLCSTPEACASPTAGGVGRVDAESLRDLAPGPLAESVRAHAARPLAQGQAWEGGGGRASPARAPAVVAERAA
ncbi:hypothetical protein ACGFYU_15955 [Streptomyces sp. NPDC048337]|uniref:hypothetical protein n=1 Tax=Streptomyces sp. NPDC048337 TaxID=3365535 RepID=UPI0037198FD1